MLKWTCRAAQRDRDALWKAKAQGEKERVRKLSSENNIRYDRLMDAAAEVAHRMRARTIKTKFLAQVTESQALVIAS